MINLQADRNPFDDLLKFINGVENPGNAEKRKVAGAVTKGFQENFSKQRAGDGDEWDPLAGITQVERRKLGFAAESPILVRTGSYRASWVNPDDTDHVEVFERTGTGWLMDIGSQDLRVSILNDGGYTIIKDKRVFVPPRPVVELSRSAQDGIGDALDFVVDQIAQRF